MSRVVAALLVLIAGCSDTGMRIAAWTASVDGSEPRPVTLPGTIDDVPDRPARIVLESEVEVPASWVGRPLTLSMNNAVSRRVVARMDGVEGVAIGGWTDGAAVHAWRFPASPARVHRLALEIDHDWSGSRDVGTAPVLSDEPGGARSYRVAALVTGVFALGAMAIMLVLGLIHGVVYALDRRGVAHGWLALLQIGAVGAALRSFETAVEVRRLSYTGQTLAAIAAVYFLHAELGLRRPSRVFALGFASVPVVWILFPDPFHAAAQALAMNLVGWCVLVYCTVRLVRHARRGPDAATRSRARWYLAAWLLLCAVALPEVVIDSSPWPDLFWGIVTVPLGLACFGLVHTVVLARDRVITARELRTLNDDLRRQIADRSRLVSDAMSSLAVKPALPAVGDVVAGRHRVVRRLGAGGMGIIFEVERVSDGRRLALKVVSGTLSAAALARFAREAQVAAALEHPNLVGIVDFDVSPGGAFLAMELVEGGSLEDDRGRFGDAAWALPVLAQVASGLAALHAGGIVHRDLKPSNVLKSGDRVKVADFGVASLGHDVGVADTRPADGATLTGTGAVIGTPRYIAPELSEGVLAAKPSSDLYSFGVLAFEVLSGRPAAEAAEGREPLGVSAAVDALVARCLARDPALRPSAREVAEVFAS